jgi:hypothetical protein
VLSGEERIRNFADCGSCAEWRRSGAVCCSVGAALGHFVAFCGNSGAGWGNSGAILGQLCDSLRWKELCVLWGDLDLKFEDLQFGGRNGGMDLMDLMDGSGGIGWSSAFGLFWSPRRVVVL